jgi:hypothetical protein
VGQRLSSSTTKPVTDPALIPRLSRWFFIRRGQASVTMRVGAGQTCTQLTFLSRLGAAGGAPYCLCLLLGYFHTCIHAAFLNRKLVNLEHFSHHENFFPVGVSLNCCGERKWPRTRRSPWFEGNRGRKSQPSNRRGSDPDLADSQGKPRSRLVHIAERARAGAARIAARSAGASRGRRSRRALC